MIRCDLLWRIQLPDQSVFRPVSRVNTASDLARAVANIYSMKVVPQSDGQPGRVTATASHKKESLGSGFMSDPTGLIVTNEHLVDPTHDVAVTLQDNLILKAQLIGASAVAEIALLRVNADRPVDHAETG